MRIGAACLLLMALSQTHSAQDQPTTFVIPRDRVLAFDMDIVSYGPYSSPAVPEHVGMVWDKPVIHPADTRAVRIHVTVSGAAAAHGWLIKFTDLSGREIERFSLPDFAPRDQRWSGEIFGRGGRIQLWTTDSRNPPVVTVDKYAFAKQPSVPKAIYGTDDRQPISAAPGLIKRRGRAVARLKFMVPQGEALCTGFLVATDLLMTNNHCIDTTTDLSTLTAEFGFDTQSSVADTFHATALEWTDHGLDY
jgi:V8-like Glu-specific endopeptidase